MRAAEPAQIKGFATLLPDDEYQNVQTVYVQPPKKKKYPLNWLTFWQNDSGIGVSMLEQAVRDDMTRMDYRVRDYLVATAEMGNGVRVNQTEIAKALGVHRVSVAESIKRLRDMMILLPNGKNGQLHTYKINPAFMFKGKMEQGAQARAEKINELKGNVIKFRQPRNLPQLGEQASLI